MTSIVRIRNGSALEIFALKRRVPELRIHARSSRGVRLRSASSRANGGFRRYRRARNHESMRHSCLHQPSAAWREISRKSSMLIEGRGVSVGCWLEDLKGRQAHREVFHRLSNAASKSVARATGRRSSAAFRRRCPSADNQQKEFYESITLSGRNPSALLGFPVFHFANGFQLRRGNLRKHYHLSGI